MKNVLSHIMVNMKNSNILLPPNYFFINDTANLNLSRFPC